MGISGFHLHIMVFNILCHLWMGFQPGFNLGSGVSSRGFGYSIDGYGKHSDEEQPFSDLQPVLIAQTRILS